VNFCSYRKSNDLHLTAQIPVFHRCRVVETIGQEYGIIKFSRRTSKLEEHQEEIRQKIEQFQVLNWVPE